MTRRLAVFQEADDGLTLGRAVEVTQGALAGMTGVLIGFGQNHSCRIKLDIAQQGVVLVVDPASVKEVPLALDEAVPIHAIAAY
jgi:hypothetical protein